MKATTLSNVKRLFRTLTSVATLSLSSIIVSQLLRFDFCAVRQSSQSACAHTNYAASGGATSFIFHPAFTSPLHMESFRFMDQCQ
mmetsp:Transcript_23677/g.33939  ORF Transcript_23677/g.33939 Transcript_23677/m.33939 type:complete len:85 (+) Transcript_23677:49-303(+)